MTPAEMMAYVENLRKYPDLQTTPTAPDPEVGRLTGAEIESRIGTLAGKPLDYSGVERVNRAQMEDAERGMAAGFLMQGGGRMFAPMGAKIFEQALGESKPMRPNAADIGYIDPRTGQFVENPQFTRGREEKVLTQALAAHDRREAARMAAADRRSTEEGRRITAENMARLGGARIIIQQQGQNTIDEKTQAYINHLESKDKTYKPMPNVEQVPMRTVANERANLEMFDKSFKPEFAGDISGTFGGELQMNIATNYPELALRMPGMTKEKMKAMQDRAAWWREQKRFDEIGERHTAFGATLTDNERAEWKASTITPGMQEWQVKEFLGKRKAIADRKIEEMRRTAIANGRNPRVVHSILQLPEPEETPAPARPTTMPPRGGPAGPRSGAPLPPIESIITG